jgi:hypothetical protein
MSDGWRIVTGFAGSIFCAHARAREAYNSKNLSLPVTRHSVFLSHLPLNGAFRSFSRANARTANGICDRVAP